MLPNNWRYLRGDIYYADMEPHIGSEQGGKRPVVVLQNNIGNRHSPTLLQPGRKRRKTSPPMCWWIPTRLLKNRP